LSFLSSYKKKYDTFGFVYFKISIFMVQESKHAFDYTCHFCHLIKRSMILLVLSTSKYQSLWFKTQNMFLITLVIFVVLWKEVWYFWFGLLQNINLYGPRLKTCFWWHLSFLSSYKKKYDTFGFVYFKISILMVQESKHAFDYTCHFCCLMKRSMILLVLSTSKYRSLWFKTQKMLLITQGFNLIYKFT
jgi:hypothetical protein